MCIYCIIWSVVLYRASASSTTVTVVKPVIGPHLATGLNNKRTDYCSLCLRVLMWWQPKCGHRSNGKRFIAECQAAYTRAHDLVDNNSVTLRNDNVVIRPSATTYAGVDSKSQKKGNDSFNDNRSRWILMAKGDQEGGAAIKRLCCRVVEWALIARKPVWNICFGRRLPFNDCGVSLD